MDKPLLFFGTCPLTAPSKSILLFFLKKLDEFSKEADTQNFVPKFRTFFNQVVPPLKKRRSDRLSSSQLYWPKIAQSNFSGVGLFVKRAEPQKKEELMKTKSRQELKKLETRKEKKMQTKKQPSGKGQELKAVINNKQKGEKIMNKKQIKEQLAELEPMLRTIAAKLTKDKQLRENAFQDGFIAIWNKLKEAGVYNNAYLRQHAKHRMFNCLAAGKSIDNGFREDIEVISINADNFVDIEGKRDLLGEIYGRDLKIRINNRISGLTKRVFTLLSKGYTQKEIAQKLNTYQKNVSRQKQKIQEVVKKLYGDELTLRKTRANR